MLLSPACRLARSDRLFAAWRNSACSDERVLWPAIGHQVVPSPKNISDSLPSWRTTAAPAGPRMFPLTVTFAAEALSRSQTISVSATDDGRFIVVALETVTVLMVL